jgi:iron complex outermembrane receptor protein
VPPLSVLAPIYGRTPASYAIPSNRFQTDTAYTLRSGVYAQNLIAVNPHWNVLVGGRVDRYDDEGTSGGAPLSARRTAVTGRAGLVFKPQPWLSLYGSVANGFTRAPILAQTPSANGPHAPETSRQFEAGAKSDWLDGRVQVTTAYFQTQKTNVLRPDPSFGPTGNNFNALLATGEVESRGIEWDLAGALTPRWNLAFNYSYLDAEITEDTNAALVGRPLPNAAPHKVGLFTRVDLPWQGAIGGSLEYVGDREEPFAGLRAPAYTVVDAHYFQQVTPRLRVLLRVDNVFDVRYSASSLFAARVGNIPGQPRTASVALTVSSRPR